MDNKKIASELVKVAKLLLAVGHTLWITNKGKIIDIPTGGTTHYGFIAENFSKLFPKEEYTEENVFDTPMEYGWVHIRNHFSNITLTGKKQAIHKNKKKIVNIIEDRLSDGDKFSLSFDYSDGKGNIKRGKYFDLPKEIDEAKNNI